MLFRCYIDDEENQRDSFFRVNQIFIFIKIIVDLIKLKWYNRQAKYYRIKGAIDTNYELVPTEYLAYKK